MEEFFKFAVYGVLFIIYLVSQVRKMKKKAEEEGKYVPQSSPKQVVIKAPTANERNIDYNKPKSSTNRRSKSVLVSKTNKTKVVDYKTFDEEELVNDPYDSNQMQDIDASSKQHFSPNEMREEQDIENVDWLKDKKSLKRAFIASEILQRKY